jgi:ABC-type multidrug transport system fused ATPase/permease subunit
MSLPASQSTPTVIFLVITIFYLIAKYFMFKKKITEGANGLIAIGENPEFNEDTEVNLKNKKLQKVLFGVYLFIVLISEYVMNATIAASICGSNQWVATLTVTFIPWILILGSLYIFMQYVPSILQPFSNTFGYLFAKLAGSTKIMERIFADKATPVVATATATETSVPVAGSLNIQDNNPLTDKTGKQLLRALKTQNNTLNEFSSMPITAFINKWTYSNDIIKDEVFNSNKDQIILYNLVYLKDLIAEFFWYLCTGVYINSVSYNYIVNLKCKQTVEKIEETAADLKNQNNSRDQKAALKQPPKIFTTSV